MSIKEKAVALHNGGYNCAQSVFAACGEYTGLDEKTALAISAGFGGGLRSGEVCGAVSGGLMALGLVFPFTDSGDAQAKQKIAQIAKELVSKCREIRGCVRCDELKAGGVVCIDLIADIAEATEDMIKKYKQEAV